MTETKIRRANILTQELKNERFRWAEQIGDINNLINKILGDCYFAAACINYYGPFSGEFRKRLSELWNNHCNSCGCMPTPDLSLALLCTNDLILRQW